MYKSNSLWDQEQDKYDSSIGNESHIDYQESGTYDGNSQSDVYSAEKGEDEKKNKEAKGIEKEVEKQEKKYEKREDATEEDVKKKAASEVHSEGQKKDDTKKDKKSHKSIEDAINKAMKEEKELVYVDD
tara:strand:- start:474 stop:860 length:387 start_codon:yes stop_codon:yes gene_type:complete